MISASVCKFFWLHFGFERSPALEFGYETGLQGRDAIPDSKGAGLDTKPDFIRTPARMNEASVSVLERIDIAVSIFPNPGRYDRIQFCHSAGSWIYGYLPDEFYAKVLAG
ncbi:unnamed protein product [Rhizophagus irregularis]|nr:unnamed protein product [Rhizophagus irregularis]